MVNTRRRSTAPAPSNALPAAAVLVRVYLAVVVGTLVALVVLTLAAPGLATGNAWGHAIAVGVFAVVLPLRLGRAQTGTSGAVRAVGLISAVLLVVNVVEALIPGFAPVWMRLDMVLVAALMVGVLLDVVRWAVLNKDRPRVR